MIYPTGRCGGRAVGWEPGLRMTSLPCVFLAVHCMSSMSQWSRSTDSCVFITDRASCSMHLAFNAQQENKDHARLKRCGKWQMANGKWPFSLILRVLSSDVARFCQPHTSCSMWLSTSVRPSQTFNDGNHAEEDVPGLGDVQFCHPN